MTDEVTALYACCPICSRPIGKMKSCDGMEFVCPKCNARLQVIVDRDSKVLVELMREHKIEKVNKNSVAPRNVGLGWDRQEHRT